MAQWRLKQLGWTSLIMLIAPAALAKPGWRDWQKITGSQEPLPYSAGFSNMELGSYLDYEDRCAQAATAAQEPFRDTQTNRVPIF